MFTKCIICGRETNSKEVICEDCRSKSSGSNAPKVDDFKIKRCKYCGRVFIDKWSDSEIQEDDLIHIYLTKNFGNGQIHYDSSGDYFNRKVIYEFRHANGQISKGQFFIKTSYHSCPSCSKRRGNYFEAIIQLRGTPEKFVEIIDFVKNIIDSQNNPDIFITKIEKKKEGFDLYISNKEYARNVSRRIVDKYGGTIIESNSLVGRKEGRDLYRFTYAVRIPQFSYLDLIKFSGKNWVVSGIHGNDISLMELGSNSLRHFKLNDLEDSKILLRKKDYKEAEVLYTQGDSTYIMNPFNYKEVAIKKIENAKSILVGNLDGEIVIIPFLQ